MSDTVDISSLSEEEQRIYLSDKIKMFKATIAICAIYGTIAFIFLLLLFFTTWGKRMLYNDMLSFVITYIIGTVVIIIYMSNAIYNFKPMKGNSKDIAYDSEMCPDYWKLEFIKPEDMRDEQNKDYFMTNNVNLNHFKHKCVLDQTLFSASKLQELDSNKPDAQKLNYTITPQNNLYVKLEDKKQTGIRDDGLYEQFKKMAATMNGYTYDNETLVANNDKSLTDPKTTFNSSKVPLSCDTVYPMYLFVKDRDNAMKSTSEPINRYRCAYSKACGVSWTDAGCV